jgi:hypothetical protein
MCLTTAADNDAEYDSIDDWSSIDGMQVVMVPQLGGHEGRQRWNNTTQD